jgi:prevent-host-death family protein
MEIAIAIAKGKLTQLVAAAERGERVIITRHGKPVARLVAAEARIGGFSFRRDDPLRKKYGLDGPEMPVSDAIDDSDLSLEVLGLK